jgi:predicted cupin superfamily sugar epimerase
LSASGGAGAGDAAGPEAAERLIADLGLEPHPEGGWYRETWRHAGPHKGRGAGSAIYFLLRAGEVSAWHRVDAAEVWHFYAGAPLELEVVHDGRSRRERLGPDVPGGERPQRVVPAGAWQRARSLGAFTLVGCTVSPAFEFAGFELAPDGFDPAASGGAG